MHGETMKLVKSLFYVHNCKMEASNHRQ